MRRFSQAISAFFAILFRGALSAELAAALGLQKKTAAPATPPSARPERVSDGALQLLAILQRDARLVDFLMEDISAYSDEQVGAAVRDVHGQCRQALSRHVRLTPVIDGVEGTYTKLDPSGADPARVRLLGNVPAKGLPPGGALRHKGWRAEKVDLPPLDPRRDTAIVAPAEIEIE